ncbi:MAG TPA: type II toxin-antitoxin system HicB family antitoxin [Terracidiphilus sp.]|jgi:antitoxin HicB|nr:type II toxin-antitoxin system HicB family antitoxin [Terracidiphilus sp.]
MRYPARLKAEEEGGYVVTFPDIPEAITQGEDVEDALMHAADALESALDFYFEDRRPVPAPSKPKRGQYLVELPVSVAAKVLLLNEMLRQKVRPAELARRLGTTPQEVNRLTNLRHSTKIDRIDAAFRALGKRLILRAA